MTIDECLYTNLLHWYGHVARRPVNHLLKEASKLFVSGSRPRGRPRKTWDATVKEIIGRPGVSPSDALNRKGWRLLIQGRPADLSSLGQGGQ